MSPLCGDPGYLWVPYIIFAQWNNTLVGCLMIPVCTDRCTEERNTLVIQSLLIIGCQLRSPEGCGAFWRPAGHVCR